MKICSKCQIEKNDDQFYTRKNGSPKGWCKSCFNAYVTARWKAIKLKAVNLLGGKCSRCGYNKNLSALDFHHVDPSTKESEIHNLSHKKWETIVIELQKCILVCKNCHCELHNPQLNFDEVTDHDFTIDRTANYFLERKSKSKQPIYVTGTCECGKPVYGTTYCSVKCYGLHCRKIVRPTQEQLDLDIQQMSMVKVGAKYGVSDNAIRKWIKTYQKQSKL